MATFAEVRDLFLAEFGERATYSPTGQALGFPAPSVEVQVALGEIVPEPVVE